MTDLPLFDPADYLDSEEGFAAYLADARADGARAMSDAMAVVDRARKRLRSAPIELAALRTHAEQRPSLRVSASAGGRPMASGKTTSGTAATSASKTLSSGSTGGKSKSAAGSALSQHETKDSKSTGDKAATNASKTLSDGRTAEDSKSAAGSALSQKKR